MIQYTENNPDADTTILLMHNAGGDRHFMQYQEEFFTNLGYRTINIDLPAHGTSKKIDDLSINAIAQSVIKLCKDIGAQNIVAIGLNYGACIAIEMLNPVPNIFQKIILLEPPIMMEEWVIKLVQKNIQELNSQDAKSHIEHLIQDSFFQTEEHNKEIAKQAFAQIRHQDLAELYKHLLIWDQSFTAKIQNCTCPTLYIQSQTAFSDEQEFLKLCPSAESAKVIGSKYWMSLEVPEQINTMIHRWIRLNK